VAEEVRNLARRSAKAARDTATLIEESQNNAENGVRVSSEVESSLCRIGEKITKLNELVGEVNTASNEQRQGIEQVNTAVTEMEKVTQRNAGTAEEAAATCQEFSHQAEQLHQMVNALDRLLGAGSNDASPTHERRKSNQQRLSVVSSRQDPQHLRLPHYRAG
jgi:methyl-accepting chemotaxis protein